MTTYLILIGNLQGHSLKRILRLVLLNNMYKVLPNSFVFSKMPQPVNYKSSTQGSEALMSVKKPKTYSEFIKTNTSIIVTVKFLRF